MSKIKVNTGYDEKNNRLLYRQFEIVEELPENISVHEVKADISNKSEVFDYNLYEVVTEDELEEKFISYYAISKYLDKEIKVKGYPANILIYVCEKNQDPITKEWIDERFDFDTDGLMFDDECDLEDYIDEYIIQKIRESFCLNERDYTEIMQSCKICMQKYIVEDFEEE